MHKQNEPVKIHLIIPAGMTEGYRVKQMKDYAKAAHAKPVKVTYSAPVQNYEYLITHQPAWKKEMQRAWKKVKKNLADADHVVVLANGSELNGNVPVHPSFGNPADNVKFLESLNLKGKVHQNFVVVENRVTLPKHERYDEKYTGPQWAKDVLRMVTEK